MILTLAPNRKQHEAWQRLQDNTTEFIVFGGAAGGGKSWLGAEWLLISCLRFPGTKYFIGRQELKQIRQSTLPTLYKALSHHGISGASLFRFNGQDNYFQFHNGSRIDLIELRHYPSDPLYERFGSLEYSQGWIEEGGEVDDLAAAMISSRTGRCYNDKYGLLGKTLITCNPKKNFLYYDYYKPWKEGTLPANKAFIQAFVHDNDKGESGYRAKLENLTGAARERLLLGNWEYDDDPAKLIDYDKILDCFTNALIPHGKKFITADVARFGDDKTVVGVWDGFRVKLYQFKGLSITETAEKIKGFQETHSIPNSQTLVDEDGVGGGVVDILKCKGFLNNSRPMPNPTKPQLDVRGNKLPENYDNLKSQCSFRMADRINSTGIYIECNDPAMKQAVIEEMEQVKQKNVDGDGKKGIVPKEEVKKVLGRSPDHWDTIMMREYFELKPIVKVGGF